MPNRANYPATVAEVIDDSITYKPAALAAVRAFARSKPWRGTASERIAKVIQVNSDLAAAYSIPVPQLFFMDLADGLLNPPPTPPGSSGSSFYRPSDHSITLTGKLSVVTYLHEFGHALGKDERQTCRWSLNLFKRCFPRSYARLRPMGHMLVSPTPSTPERSN